MDVLLEQIKGVISYFKKYRDEGFSRSIDIAKEIAKEMDIEPVVIWVPLIMVIDNRQSKRRKHFDEQNDLNGEESLSSIESFGVNYFMAMIDMAIDSLNSRFEEMEVFENLFGFLLNSERLKLPGVPPDSPVHTGQVTVHCP
ncbi:hypothetical protein ACJX0J_032155, partial [Zea mays]